MSNIICQISIMADDATCDFVSAKIKVDDGTFLWLPFAVYIMSTIAELGTYDEVIDCIMFAVAEVTVTR